MLKLAIQNILPVDTLIFQNISCNKLGTEGARFVCEVLQENTSLKELNVSRNDFKDSDAQYFAEALKQNFRLKVFKTICC